MNNLNKMKDEKVIILLIKYSLPAMLGMVIQTLYFIIDRIFIGQTVGAPGIAGLTISFPIMLVGIAFSILIGTGTSTLVSIKLGEQNLDEATKIFNTASLVVFCISIFLTFIGLFFLNDLLFFFGARQEIISYATDYSRIILYSTFFLLYGLSFTGCIRCDGSPQYAMYTMLCGAILNILLDYILIIHFKMGVKGAAIATAISMTLSSLLVFSYFLTKKSNLKIKISYLRFNSNYIKSICIIGLPPFFVELSISLLNIVVNNRLQFYGGDIAVSSMGIINGIFAIFITLTLGLNQGAQPLIGYNHGAKLYNRTTEITKTALIGSFLLCSCGSVIVLFFPEKLISLFVPDNIELLTVCKKGLIVFLLCLPLSGPQIIATGYLQSTGKIKKALFASVCRPLLFFIPLLYILPPMKGLQGIWLSGPISDIGAFLCTMTLIYFDFNMPKTKYNCLENSSET